MLLLSALAMVIVLEARKAGELRQLQQLGELAPSLSGLVHELQKERGNSAGFIGSGGDATFTDRLAAQRLISNEAREGLAAAVAAFPAESYGATFADKLNAAMDDVARLEEERVAVSALNRSVGAMAAYYTGAIAKLLRVIEEMAILSTDSQTTQAITAYTNFLQAKERAGIERAMGSAGFSAGAFAPNVHQRFLQLVAQQEAFLDNFRTYARPEQLAFFDETVQGDAVDDVARMRELAIANAYGEELGGVAGPYWFDQITKKIDLLKRVEDRLSDDLKAQVKSAGDAAVAALIGFVLLSVILAGGVTAAIVFATRSVTRPLGQIQTVMGELSKGDYSVSIPGLDRRDELGDMAAAVEVLKEAAAESEQLRARQAEREKAAEEERRASLLKQADELESTVGSIVEGFAAAIHDLSETSAEVSDRARQSEERAQSVTDAAGQASVNVQTVAASSEDMDMSISEIVKQVSRSEDVARE
ncbi:MAG: methyl-accepting chemotaxis protein, partial [Pseudomonadota bacterium]